MSRETNNHQLNLAIFSSFDKEIKEAVQHSENNKCEVSVNKLKNIKNIITGTMLSTLSFIQEEFQFGIYLLDEKIAQAESRYEEANKKRLITKLPRSNDNEDYVTPEIKSLLGGYI